MNIRISQALAGLILLTTSLWSQIGHARELNLAHTKPADANVVHVETGAEYGFVAGAGYTRVLPAGRTQLFLGADLTLPYTNFDFADLRARVHLTVPMFRRRGWAVAGRVSPLVRITKNEVHRATSLGSEFTVLGGYYHSKWFLAAAFGVDWSMASHLQHTKDYLESKYPGAKDGWYRSPGANLHYGAIAGYSFKRVDLVLRVGQNIGIQGSGHQLPVYAILGVNIRFGRESKGTSNKAGQDPKDDRAKAQR